MGELHSFVEGLKGAGMINALKSNVPGPCLAPFSAFTAALINANKRLQITWTST